MIEINNLTIGKIDIKSLKKTAEKVLKGENPSTGSGLSQKGDLSIALVCGARMRSINKKYRKKDKATDVLSFEKTIGLGEIVICPEVVRKNAKNLDLDYNKELTRALIHGILHILGYDHEKSPASNASRSDAGWEKKAKIMEDKTEYYLSNI